MGKCAVRRTALWVRLWFYIIQGFTNVLWKSLVSIAKCGMNLYHSSLVKGTMNAAQVCKLRNGVKKHLNFFYFQWKKVNRVRSEYLRSYLNWWHNWQLKNRRRSHTLKGSHSMGNGRIFLKTCRDVSFNKVLWNEPTFGRIYLAVQYL